MSGERRQCEQRVTDPGEVSERRCRRNASQQQRGRWLCTQHARPNTLPPSRPASPPPAVTGEAMTAARALDTAAANVLLAFHDWPQYESGDANQERRDALDSLAEAVVTLRASLLSEREGQR